MNNTWLLVSNNELLNTCRFLLANHNAKHSKLLVIEPCDKLHDFVAISLSLYTYIYIYIMFCYAIIYANQLIVFTLHSAAYIWPKIDCGD